MSVESRATIYDVAAEAGVSITTVSRFLNSPNNVREETGTRIARAMEKLDYVPQGNAGSRANRAVGRIGVLTPFFPAPSFVDRLRGLIPPLRQNNYEVVVYTIESPDQLDEYLTSVPFMRRIDGLILMSIQLSSAQHRILQASGLNVVMIEADNEHYSRVLADDLRGGRLAAELFIKKNYLPCAYMGDKNKDLPYSCHPSEMRLEGFVKGLEAGGYTLNDAMILEADTVMEDARRVFGEFLDSGRRPRAIFAMSDVQSVGILKAARERGLAVPQNLAVLGFDDIESADWLDLSSISQHLEDSGRAAAGLLMDLIGKKSRAIQKVNLQVSLVERGTT